MFSERLKQLRKEKGLTQIELAKAIGVSGGTVAMWETGKRRPSFEMLNILTDFFDRSLDYILGTPHNPSPEKLTESKINPLGQWVAQEEYEDFIRKYSLLDGFGQKAVEGVLRAEFIRCHEQGTLQSGSMSVSVKIRKLKDTDNDSKTDLKHDGFDKIF